MTVLLDTGILYAAYDRRDRWHRAARSLIEEETGELVVPAPVIPEVDFLLGRRLGPPAQRSFCQGLAGHAYLVADLPPNAYARVLALNDEYPTLRLGFVDAAVVAIAEELGVRRLATTDRRHFGVVRARLELELVPEAPR